MEKDAGINMEVTTIVAIAFIAALLGVWLGMTIYHRRHL